MKDNLLDCLSKWIHTRGLDANVRVKSQYNNPGGYQNGGGVPPEPHGAHGEREIKKLRVTKRELLNNLSNIYKRKVNPGGTFSLGNFLFGERENYQI